MAPKGLQPGDTFAEGKLTYVVVAVNADGSYDAKLAEKTKEVKRGRPKKASAQRPCLGRTAFYHICGGMTLQE